MDLMSETVQPMDMSEPSSPLKSMSLTTDTLSLRQSHIGTNYPNSYVMVNEYQKSIGSVNSGHIHEFIQYPPDIISTTVERSSGPNWGYQSKTALISHQNNENIRFIRNSNKTKINRMSSQESVVTNDCSQECNGFDRQSIVSVIESTHSSDSNVFPIDAIEDIEGIKETKSVSTETTKVVMINEYSQVSISDDNSTGPLFQLKRSNANMKGKLEQLDHIMEEMVKERSELQMKLHSIEKELKVRTDKIDELNAQRESLLSDCEELKSGINKWESIVGEYQEVVDAKTHEIQALNEDVVKMSKNNEKIKINFEHLKIDLESKENTIKQLNKRVLQMNTEMDSLIQTNVSLEEEIKKTKTDMESIYSQKECLELELNKLQVRLNETHQKLVSEQQVSITARNDCEKAQTLNAVLKQQLIEVKHKAVKEKELLMRHLEGIGADLVQKEAEKELFSPKRDETFVFLSKTTDEMSEDFKQKLFDKNIRIENLSRDSKQLTKTIQKLVNENQLITNQLNSIKRLSIDKDYEIQTHKSYNSDLEFKIRGLNIDLKRQKELNDMLRKDKKDSESKLNSLVFDNKSLETATKQLKDTIEKHERSLKRLQSDCIAKETKLELIENEKSKYLNTIHMREQELAQIKQSLSTDTNDSSELNISELKVQNRELEKVMNTMNSELRANQIRFDEQKQQLFKEYSELESKMSEERQRFESFRNNANEEHIRVKELNEKLKTSENKVNELQSVINSMKSRNNNNNNNKSETDFNSETKDQIIQLKNEKIRSLESNVKLLTKKYREVIENKKEMETKLEILIQKSTSVTKILVSTQTEDLFERTDYLELNNQNEKLRQEIESLKEEIRFKDSVIEDNQKSILKLEHEMGKLSSAGHNSTNQHIMSLEVLIESKSEEVLDLTEKLSEKNKSLKELEIKLNKKLNEMENDLKKEKAVVKDLRHSVFSEKRENNYIKKDFNELKKALSESNAIADKRRQEVIDIENEIKNHKEMESSLRNEIERIQNELKSVKEENSKLKTRIDSSVNKNEPLLEQLKNLSINLKEKNQEIEGIKEQFNCTKERYQTEVQGMKQQIDSYKKDLQLLNNELNELRKTKFGLQSRLGELRAVLKNSFEQNKKLRQQLNASHVVVSQETTFNEELVTKLLDQSVENSKEIKPLVNLQACVESLKVEMELLQKQISEHNN